MVSFTETRNARQNGEEDDAVFDQERLGCPWYSQMEMFSIPVDLKFRSGPDGYIREQLYFLFL